MREHLLPRFLLALLLALGLALAALTRPLAPGFALSFSPLTAFPLHLGHRLGQNLRAAWSALSARQDLLAENQRLKEEVARLTTENARLRLEVARLARALEVKAGQAPGVVAVAPVVAEDASGLYRRLVLGLGSQDGLRPGMPVTAPQGLVGLVVEVEAHRALVRTLLDPESRVGVRVGEKPGRGVARGAPRGFSWPSFPPRWRWRRGTSSSPGPPWASSRTGSPWAGWNGWNGPKAASRCGPGPGPWWTSPSWRRWWS